MAITNWEVQKRSDQCLTCEKNFEHDEIYLSGITINGETIIREDYCQECWKSLAEKKTLFWKGTYKQKEKKEEKKDKKQIIEDILKQYLHSADVKQSKYCYIMALMLERKKILVEKNKKIKTSSGKKLIVFEHTKTGEAYVMERPEIDLLEVSTLQREIDEILIQKGIENGKI